MFKAFLDGDDSLRDIAQSIADLHAEVIAELAARGLDYDGNPLASQESEGKSDA